MPFPLCRVDAGGSGVLGRERGQRAAAASSTYYLSYRSGHRWRANLSLWEAACLQSKKLQVDVDPLVSDRYWRRSILDLDGQDDESKDYGVQRGNDVDEAAAEDNRGGASYASNNEEGSRKEGEDLEEEQFACVPSEMG